MYYHNFLIIVFSLTLCGAKSNAEPFFYSGDDISCVLTCLVNQVWIDVFISLLYYLNKFYDNQDRDFPGSAVVKNPPANAEDTGSIPGLGRSHVVRSN